MLLSFTFQPVSLIFKYLVIVTEGVHLLLLHAVKKRNMCIHRDIGVPGNFLLPPCFPLSMALLGEDSRGLSR